MMRFASHPATRLISIIGLLVGFAGLLAGGIGDNHLAVSSLRPDPNGGLTERRNYKGETRYVTPTFSMLHSLSIVVAFGGVVLGISAGSIYYLARRRV
jgi:hypothetical protein